jgi:hypothetical protein
MQWLKDHAYLAEWLALPLALFVAVLQNWGKKPADIDITNGLYYLAFLTSLASAFNPAMPIDIRYSAHGILIFLLVFMAFRRKPDQK